MDIQSLLGDEAESLLKHESKGIPADDLHLPGPDYIDRYANYYRAVTVGQVNEAARKHLHPDRATLVIAGTLAKAGK